MHEAGEVIVPIPSSACVDVRLFARVCVCVCVCGMRARARVCVCVARGIQV